MDPVAAAILSLAQVLVEQGERAAALDVAGHGLDMTGQESKTELARWTVTLAQGADDPRWRCGGAMAFTSSYELADYQVAQHLAGADWPAVKAGLLDQLAHSTSYCKVDIYLYEHMLAEAMAVVDGRSGAATWTVLSRPRAPSFPIGASANASSGRKAS